MKFKLTRVTGGCSITGGYRYGGNLFPGLQGTYFYGDLCTGKIWGAVQTAGGWTSELLLDTALTVTTFGEDENGEVYVADFSSGTVYRIVEVFPGISFTAASGGGGGCFITIVLQ